MHNTCWITTMFETTCMSNLMCKGKSDHLLVKPIFLNIIPCINLRWRNYKMLVAKSCISRFASTPPIFFVNIAFVRSTFLYRAWLELYF